MEFPTAGKHCAHSTCNRLDFLPLQCKCGRVFCSDHFRSHCEQCEQSKYLKEDELKTIDNVLVCSHPGCKERSIVPLICERCKRHYCIKHRHLSECQAKDAETIRQEKEKYAAPVRVFNEAKAAVDLQVETTLNEAKKKSKTREMANKVQLMKIKSKATGSKAIPTADRLYFNVTYADRTAPVFVSSHWSLGRAIDAISQEMKLQNNNHKANEKKLKLFKKGDERCVVSDNFSINLKQLLEERVIIDGDCLIIDYVEN
ncbi:unnamed protein product [Phyllotreta striolata]|uniref:AN1-type domain-containing protein n=1 Tax=Phyllotreta striolata TaxID=444603 RepID=A0A9N9TP72_PHYSR|nr:unnamed protein product [Phyllotreta striolata]